MPSPTSGSGLLTASIVTASVSEAAFFAGFIFNIKVNSVAGDMETTPGTYSSGKESDRINNQRSNRLSCDLLDGLRGKVFPTPVPPEVKATATTPGKQTTKL